ncbi:G-protein coupled receptor moody-like [Strongylocentrotus purpuratus]|uniref:G-protein coupled receptors family 1 profile domain-containing protein n=1 Tax=Strongylocentrotus purpuratus TaxID=7668 RepID=A0A7M7PW43_STRPU|nr:G-protein coupled receptor moody-like [Strongylocentrotus purpuratus]|eukprot:XP_001177953.1 PREDICTED: G-protein coupled receptor moody-like [Strongylocentrotus purpuratus]
MNISSTSTYEDENFGERVSMAVLLCIISFLGIVGNTLTIFSVIACRRLQTLPNAFVVSLSLSDFLNCSINIPVQVTALTQKVDGTIFNFVCMSSAILNYLLITCSVSMLDLIAINRYILVTKSHRIYTFLYNKRNMVVTIGGVWFSSAAVLIALGPTGVVLYGYSNELSLCQLKEESRVIDVICGLLFSGSFIIVSSCYTKIYIHVRKHLRQVAHIRLGPGRPTPSTSAQTNSSGNISNIIPVDTTGNRLGETATPRPYEKEDSPVDETENRITMNMIIIVVCFFLCILPTLVIVLLPGTQNAGLFTVVFLYSASCCNPIIYAWKHPVFRKVFKCIFKRRWAEIEEPSPWLRAMLPR